MASRVLKKGLGGVTSAVGPDARSRDAGDAVSIVEERRRRRRSRAAATRRADGLLLAAPRRPCRNLRDDLVSAAECKSPDATPEIFFQHPAKLTRGIFLLAGLLSLCCAGTGEKKNLLTLLGDARPTRPLRLALPDLTEPLSEIYPAPAQPGDPVEKAVFERINRDRTDAGRLPVAWDEAAARVARTYCAQQVREHTSGHYLMDGLAPYARTGLAGVFGLQSENAVSWRTTEARFERTPSFLALDGHQQMMEEKPPADGHRRTILDPDATHVGVGWVLEKGSFRMTQEFLTRDLAHLELQQGRNRQLVIFARGAVVAHRKIQFVTFCWEPEPRPLSREEASGRRTYSYPRPERAYVPDGHTRSRIVGATTQPLLRLRRNGEFSLRFAPEKAGLWTLIFHTGAAFDRARPGGSVTLWVKEEGE